MGRALLRFAHDKEHHFAVNVRHARKRRSQESRYEEMRPSNPHHKKSTKRLSDASKIPTDHVTPDPQFSLLTRLFSRGCSWQELRRVLPFPAMNGKNGRVSSHPLD